MKRGKILKMDNMKNMTTFTDIENQEAIFCLDEENFNIARKTSKFYADNNEPIPEKETIKAYVITRVDEFNEFSDLFDVNLNETIDFPIKNIQWAWGIY